MDFIPLVLVASVIKKVIDFVKYLAGGDVNAVVTQLVAWAAGVGMAFLTANSDYGTEIMVNGRSLSSLNGWALTLLGLNIASLAGVGWDTIKAIDSSNSAAVPDLLAPREAISAQREV